MTYYGGKDLAAAFRTVRGNTIKIAEDVPEDQYDFKATPDTRSVREMLVHIALSTLFSKDLHESKITDLSKIDFQDLMAIYNAEQAKERTKADILALLEERGEAFASYVEGLSDDFLGEPLTMMPGSDPPVKSRFEILMGSKEHEMHHRGQLMLIERMIGVVPHLTREREERMARMQAAQSRQ